MKLRAYSIQFESLWSLFVELIKKYVEILKQFGKG